MLKIIAPQLGIAPETLLGGEACDREILVGLSKKGVLVEILLPKGKPHPQISDTFKVTSVAVPHAPAFLYNLIFLPYLFRLYHQEKFKIIRVHSPRFIGLGVLLFRLFHSEVKVIASYHNFWETNFLFLTKFINKQWDYIFCDSQFVAKRITQEIGISESKVTFAHNGVADYFKPLSKDVALEKKYNLENKWLFLSIGFLIDRKDPIFLIEVFADIIKNNPKVVLGFLGEGPLKQTILDKSKKLGIAENVIVFNPVKGEERVKYFNLADVLVHPAKEEGFSLSVIEAMRCGKPIIINRGYSSEEQVDDKKTGFLCKMGDHKNWQENVRFLIDNPQKMTEMGLKAYKKAEQEFNWDNAVTVHIEMIKKLQ